MRALPLLVASLFVFGCRADGKTNYIPDQDEDGVNQEDDCDDDDPRVGQGATYYADADLDGHGDPATALTACERPAGYSEVGDDCVDTDGAIFPGAEDVCDKVDNDCDGVVDNGLESTAWYVDNDMDGYGDDTTVVYDCVQPAATVSLGGDCDDTDPAYNPGVLEEDCEDPNDYNCDGSVGYVDADGDGYAACDECDDGNGAINPGATEVCNDADDDCDRLVDDDDDSVDPSAGVTVYADLDGDGFGDPASPATVCDAGPGWVADATDCNDARVDINPGAVESCNGYDDDCDSLIDDADDSLDPSSGTLWYTDGDADGYGEETTAIYACEAPAGAVALSGDCDDGDAAYNPGAVEADCTDPNDYNCDGTVGYTDADGDGFAACEECDDADAAVFPGATELCDGVDDDCDGTVDEADAADASTWYADSDGDSFGDASSTTPGCSAPAGYVADATDCDDTRAGANPASTELCDGYDNDCDGAVDEGASGDATDWYADSDGDSFGDATTSVSACGAPAGYVADDTDCDDTESDVNPAALESCNGMDDDCDGTVDEDSAVDAGTWYIDADGDGYGDAASTVVDCDQPLGYVATGGDCDDAASSVSPAGSESCNGIDDDCDGAVDDGVLSVWYADGDGDGYGNPASTTSACSAPAGYGTDATDCDDTRSAVHPLATEACNGYDDDCDGATDEAGATGGTVWYADTDGDGYGDASSSTTACTAPSGYVAGADDCDDGDSSVSPAASDVCDTIDNDCDGAKDEEGLCPCDVDEYGGHAYMFCDTAATVAAGETVCLTYGYDLVAINDAAENTFVNDAARAIYSGKWWTGYSDAATEGTWLWSNGDTSTYTNWHSGEPNDSGSGEDCMQLGRYSDDSWNDEPCTSSFRFICEE